jgi:hypothetical protein
LLNSFFICSSFGSNETSFILAFAPELPEDSPEGEELEIGLALAALFDLKRI